MDATNLAELYDVPTMEWGPIAERLAAGVEQAPGDGGPDRHTCWLTTLGSDGAPHTTGIGAIWAEGAWWFETGERTRKGRNLAADPRCTIAVATHDFDLVVEGTAAIVTDPDVVAARARQWAEGGWPCEVDESGTALTAPFSAPSAGRPPWRVYRIEATRYTALATVEPGGATTWVP